MLNQSIRNIALPSLMSLLIIGLLVHLAGQTVAPVLAQDGGTATSTPETSSQDSGVATTTSEVCSEDPATGERTCSQIVVSAGTVDIISAEPAGISGQSGVIGQACERDSITGETFCSEALVVENNVKSAQVPNDGSFRLSANFLNVNDNYSLVVSRSSSATAIGFQNSCLTDTQTISTKRPRQGRYYNYSHDFTVKTCAAAQTTITAKLVKNRSAIRTLTWTFTSTAAPTSTSSPSSTATPTPTATPAPTTSLVAYPKLPPTPKAPSDTSGTWEVNLVSGVYQAGKTYGYQNTVIGSVNSNRFQYDGKTFTVKHLRWRESGGGKLEFLLDKCLKKSDFISLEISDRTFDTPDELYTDAQCKSDSSRDQRFTFNTSTNPLNSAEQKRVRLTMKGDSNDPSIPETILIAVGSRYASANESVALRTSAISGAKYQWQKESASGSWSSASSLSTTTIAVSSPRGTQKYRVVATLRSGETIESQPAYVTWDEIDILTNLTKALVSNVTSTRAYTNAESALRQCVNKAAKTSYRNLDEILSNYHGTSKTTFESSCNTQLTAMFSALESEFRSKLQNLTKNNTEYRKLLAADHYDGFAKSVGEAKVLRRNSWKLASEEARISRANAGRGFGGASDDDSPTTTRVQCLPTREPASLQAR